MDLIAWENLPASAAIVAAVAHKEFKSRPLSDYVDKLQKAGVLTDVKSTFDEAQLVSRGVTVWRL